MIAQIKAYTYSIIIICLLIITCIIGWKLHSVETEYETYKDSINDQVQKAEIEKARIEAEQKSKYDRESADYAADIDRLNRILNGLQKSGAMPRETGVRVAGSSPNSLPRKAEDTDRTLKDFATTARTECPTFYSEAMRDALQCSHLIEFVKD
jgi:hypothetical protein